MIEELKSQHSAMTEQEHEQKQEMSQLLGEVAEQASQLRQAQALSELLQEKVLLLPTMMCCQICWLAKAGQILTGAASMRLLHR